MIINFLASTVFFFLIFLSGCSSSEPAYYLPGPERVDGPGGLGATVPVLFGIEAGTGDKAPRIRFELNKRAAPARHIAHVRLVISGIPRGYEGQPFTIIGGGTDDRGLHGPESTGFSGKGYHFARSEPGETENVRRSEVYKKEYTRRVREGRLSFEIYYEPSDINEWGNRYFHGTEVALTMMRAGTEQRVLHAANNRFNWAIAGVGAGRSADVIIELQ
ncbi:MAG: hypothetical protein LAT67_15115 [Balneolales bacterium]|nr:hypothetical protein [Balneolales bacterium]